jgi:DNA-binding HxlR family transcriptional regulator
MSSDYDLREMRVLIDILADKWTFPVLGAMCANDGRRRFNMLKRDLPSISQKSLVACLRRLEMHGLITRTVFTTGRLAVEYSVTPLGHTLDKPVSALLAWSNEHALEIDEAKASFAKTVSEQRTTQWA